MAAEVKLGYFDTSALMRWVERDVVTPTELNQRVGAAVDELLASPVRLAVSELTLVEVRASIARHWRVRQSGVKQSAQMDTAWAEQARASLMGLLADGRVEVVPVPPKAFEQAMTLVDMAAIERTFNLGTWDAIHLITAIAWGHSEGERVSLYASDNDYDNFTTEFPHFLKVADIVNLDYATRT